MNDVLLKNATIEEIYAEINSREKKNPLLKYEKQFLEIKSLNFNGITTADCVVVYDMINGYDDNPNFSFYYKGKDFYYGETGMSYEEFSQLIPSVFAECCENVYELPRRYTKSKNSEEALQIGLDILKKCGYVTFKENEERYI